MQLPETFYSIGFWVKFTLVSLVVVILPVWVLTFVEISFFKRIMFTLAGFVGVLIALHGRTIGKKHGFRR